MIKFLSINSQLHVSNKIICSCSACCYIQQDACSYNCCIFNWIHLSLHCMCLVCMLSLWYAISLVVKSGYQKRRKLETDGSYSLIMDTHFNVNCNQIFYFQKLTAGVLLLRNKFYIVMYRGKDFLPTSVATALAERQELTEDTQTVEERIRNNLIGESSVDKFNGHALAGTLAEFEQAQARWGKNITFEVQEKLKEEASRSDKARLFKRIEHKLSIVSFLSLTLSSFSSN